MLEQAYYDSVKRVFARKIKSTSEIACASENEKGITHRTEVLRTLANRDMFHLFAGREEHEAERFGRLCGQYARPKRKRRS